MKSLFCVLLPCFLFNLACGQIDLSNGLIGYWPLDGNANDYSTSGNHGSILPNAYFTNNPTGSNQVLQAVYSANANEGHVDITLPGSFYPSSYVSGYQGSGAFWVMIDDNTGMAGAASYQGFLRGIPGIHYVTRLKSQKRLLAMTKSGGGANVWPHSGTGSIPNLGEWYHIAWTFESHATAGHLRWYINGTLTNEYTGLLTIKHTDFRIGAGHERQATNHKIAEVRLYDRILTLDEISTLSDQTSFNDASISLAFEGLENATVGDVIDPSTLTVGLVDTFGHPLGINVPTMGTPLIVSGPAVYDDDGSIVIIGSGTVVLSANIDNNDYVASGVSDIGFNVSSTSEHDFNTVLWDENTGTGFYVLYDPMEAGISTYNMEAIRISSTGNVGIQTNTPQETLDVEGNIQTTGSVTAAAGVTRIKPDGSVVINEGDPDKAIVLGADGTVTFPPQGDIPMANFGGTP